MGEFEIGTQRLKIKRLSPIYHLRLEKQLEEIF